MKLALAIFACVAVVGLNAAIIPDRTHVVDKAFLEKQKFLFEILYRVEEPLQFEEYISLGSKLIVDTAKYQKYDELMTKFYNDYKSDELLPKGEYFSAVNKEHAIQGLGLFNFFYYANDYKTLMQNIVWARINVNEGMFVYALTLTVIRRPDMKDFILPSISEIFPHSFFNAKFISQVERFDSDAYNRQILLEKELKTAYHKDNFIPRDNAIHRHHHNHIHHKDDDASSNYFYLKDWKTWQWWKLMGLDDGFHREEKHFLRDNIQDFLNDPKYKDVLSDVKAYYLPVDYTRDVGIFNEESKLSYFTEDVGLNAYWYNLNMMYPVAVNGTDRLGEYWIYAVQQVLSRYYMERLSHGMGINDELTFFSYVNVGYDSQLKAYNGNAFTPRKNNYEVSYNAEVVNAYRKLMEIAESDKFVMNDGVEIDLTKPEGIEFIGKLALGKYDILDKSHHGFWYNLANIYFNGGQFNDLDVKPNVLQNYETMLRDPITYQLFRKIVNVYYRFKSQLPAYTQEQLMVPGVKIEDVEVSELKTYFDLVDYDVTNLLNEKMKFVDGKFIWDKTLLVRQMRLNHIPYNYNIKVKSEQAKKVMVRTYLAPDFDEYGQKIDLVRQQKYFLVLDAFVYDLPAGSSVIKRNSKENYYTISDQTTYTELYKYVMLAYEGKQDLPSGISQPVRGYPDRLTLPHGWVKGMPMKMFFMISEFNGSQYDFPSDHKLDQVSLGYPFDREIENTYQFVVPNMYFKDVKIYHVDKLDKYYPLKYDNFGHFDYDF